MPDDLCADLNELLPGRGQRPLANFPGQRQSAEKIAGIVHQGEELKPHLVLPETVT